MPNQNKLLYLNRVNHKTLVEWLGQTEDGRAVVARWEHTFLLIGAGTTPAKARRNLLNIWQAGYQREPTLEQVQKDVEFYLAHEDDDDE